MRPHYSRVATSNNAGHPFCGMSQMAQLFWDINFLLKFLKNLHIHIKRRYNSNMEIVSAVRV